MAQQTELKLLSQLAKESLITENYALIEWFIKQWGKDRTTVINLNIKSDNGFSIVDFQRPNINKTEVIANYLSIPLHDETYTIHISNTITEINQQLNELAKQLFLVSTIATILLAISIWYLFQWIAIRPLTHEIKLRKIAEQEIQREQRFLQAVINGLNDGIMVIKTNYEVELLNSATGAPIFFDNKANSRPRYCYQISHHRDSPCEGVNHPCPLDEVLKTGKYATTLHNHPDKQGNNHYFELLASPFFDEKGKLTGIIESSREVTTHIKLQNKLKEKQQHFHYLAHHDSLTGLPNRLLFMDRLEQTLLKAKRNEKSFALFFIDLDQFKQINDSVGHNIGDEVLIQTAKKLIKCVRSDDTIARLGGDEFTIILSTFNHIDDVSKIANKVNRAVQKPLLIYGNKYHITASIGISTYPQDAKSIESLLRNADSAMFKVKEQGRNSYQFYTEELTLRALKRVELENGIHKALIEKHFIAWYQPQYEISSEKLVGMEALVRWMDPVQGIIPPNDFIPLAEECGLIIKLGEQILDLVMQQVVSWHNEGLNPGSVAINLSVKQLMEGNITTTIAGLLKKHKCSAEWLELEVTEGFVMGKREKAIKRLEELHNMGFKIAIDDFGTGYSSLSYLKHLPVSKLKIDRSFIQDLPVDKDDVGISRAVIALSHGLGMEVIAEGVETTAQANFLQKEGCALAQGYLYSKPIPATEIENLLKASHNK
jgi:diguanylate cyclase (GGDEF)-like protein